MITRFKIFENQENEKFFYDVDDLTSLFTQKFIEDYYEENYEIDFEEDVANALNLWSYVNIDDVRDSFIRELANDTEIDDKKFKKQDYIVYIRDNMKDVDISVDDLQKMTRNEVIEIISEGGEDTEFLINYYEDEFGDSHPEEILYVIYGKHAVKDSNFYSYLKEFLDEEELIEAYKNRIDFDTKLEYIANCIERDKNLQRMLLDMNPNTAEALFNEMVDDRSIGNEYNFQKTYIDVVLKHLDFDDQDELNDIISEELKQIDEKFGLNPKIIKDYSNQYNTYLMKKDANKYNL